MLTIRPAAAGDDAAIWSIIGLLDSTFGLGVMNGGAAVDPGRNQIQTPNFTN